MADQMGGVSRLGRGARLTRAAALALLVGATASCTPTKTADGGVQGWTSRQQSDWYGATQGSRLIPWDWAQALTAPGSSAKFFDAAYLERFRLLARGPGQLPVGMAVDRQDDRGLSGDAACAGSRASRTTRRGSASTAPPATPARSPTRARTSASTAGRG